MAPTVDYQAWKLHKLANPVIAASYLNEALKESPATFLSAVGTVAKARDVASVAKEAGVARESLYRAFSVAGNPTLKTMYSVLRALGLRMTLQPLVNKKS